MEMYTYGEPPMSPRVEVLSPDLLPAGQYAGLGTAFQLLLQGRDYAAEASRDRWDFAVSLRCLRAAGVTENEVRQFICRGLLEHALERTRPADSRRVFQKVSSLALYRRSCFVLTGKGVSLARRVLLSGEEGLPPNGGQSGRKEEEGCRAELPFWDEACHTVFWRGRALKHYRSEAPNQEAVLHAFQAHRWQRCVTVALPEDTGLSPKERLHDTIKNLNRAVSPHLRFHQEGSGSRVSWEPLGALPQSHPNATLEKDGVIVDLSVRSNGSE